MEQEEPEDPRPPQRALALSGGGFRAALFHAGAAEVAARVVDQRVDGQPRGRQP